MLQDNEKWGWNEEKEKQRHMISVIFASRRAENFHKKYRKYEDNKENVTLAAIQCERCKLCTGYCES